MQYIRRWDSLQISGMSAVPLANRSGLNHIRPVFMNTSKIADLIFFVLEPQPFHFVFRLSGKNSSFSLCQRKALRNKPWTFARNQLQISNNAVGIQPKSSLFQPRKWARFNSIYVWHSIECWQKSTQWIVGCNMKELETRRHSAHKDMQQAQGAIVLFCFVLGKALNLLLKSFFVVSQAEFICKTTTMLVEAGSSPFFHPRVSHCYCSSWPLYLLAAIPHSRPLKISNCRAKNTLELNKKKNVKLK